MVSRKIKEIRSSDRAGQAYLSSLPRVLVFTTCGNYVHSILVVSTGHLH